MARPSLSKVAGGRALGQGEIESAISYALARQAYSHSDQHSDLCQTASGRLELHRLCRSAPLHLLC